MRVRAAHRDQPRDEEWLIIEWAEGAREPAHYWFSNLPTRTAWPEMADTVMSRWRIERDYEELKQELGLGHYEGRNWRGFHHHASLCIEAYGFLMLEQLRKKNLHFFAFFSMFGKISFSSQFNFKNFSFFGCKKDSPVNKSELLSNK